MKLTLRAQLAIATALVTALVVALAGVFIALRMDQRDRAAVDQQLLARADRLLADSDKLLGDAGQEPRPGDDGYGTLLDGSESLVRILDEDTVLVQRGAIPARPLPAPATDGLDTITVDGNLWRSYVVSAPSGSRLQVLQSLQPVNDRRAANTQLVLFVTILAAALSGAVGWLVGTAVLRPLHRLSDGATAISNDPDPHHRLPDVDRPAEISALSTALNGMLDRLEASTETTRRFAADVGHELRGPLTASTASLEALLTTEDLPAPARDAVALAHNQQLRMTATLSALQVMARVDAGAVPEPGDIEPGVLVDELVRLARHRHPETTYTFDDQSDGASVAGWADGLRIAIDNLLDNAAIHGRPRGNVTALVGADTLMVTVTVDDDGPGIPPDQRDLLRQRFTRAAGATAPGSGLGLALVDQLAGHLNGELRLRTSTHNGLRVELSLPRSR